MKGLSEEDMYKLMDIFSITDAACLIAGISPNQAYYNEQYDEWEIQTRATDPENAFEVFHIAVNALKNSIRANKLKATVIVENSRTPYLTQLDMQEDWLLTHAIDLKNTTIDKDDLINWLKNRSVYPAIFFPQGRISDISNKNHKFYSPKLHAVVDAWESLFTADIQSTTIKKYLTDWIKTKKDLYGLDITSDQKFSELAEIANFDKGGNTIFGNPLHHFGIDTPPEDIKINKYTINPDIYAKFSEKSSTQKDGDLPF